MSQQKNITSNAMRDDGLNRGLKARHIQLMTLGGIVGSGYFLGTGEVIGQVGPSIFLAYIFGGLIVYLTMLCMGELAVAIPISGSFITYAADFISPSMACGIGWTYWISWVVYIPAECIAGGIIMEHFTNIDGHIWALGFGMVITCINLMRIEIFGEIEFWLSLIKITALIIFVIIAAFIFFGVIHGPREPEVIGFKFIWGEGGLFPNGFAPFFSAMILLLVNYQGTEIIGLAAGESITPEKTIPKAIQNVTFRILLIYVIPVLCLVLIFPWQNANLENSVFSEVLNYYGLEWAGTVTSIVIIIASISCSNSGLYSCARSLNALARSGMAPYKLKQLNCNAVPRNAAILTLIAMWAVLIFSYFFGQHMFYIALLLVSGFTCTTAWISICWSQINFRKRLYQAGYSIKDLNFHTPFSPYTAIIAIALMSFSMIFLLFNEDKFYTFAFILGIFSFIIPILIYRLNYKKGHKHKDTNESLKFDDVFPNRQL